MQRRRNFTLAELGVVTVFVVVVVALAVIFWPLLVHHPKSKGSPCQSNLKQLALGIRMYTSDWDERLPWNSYHWGGHQIGWEEAVWVYVQDWTMYYCPSQFALGGHSPPTAANLQNVRLGYGANQTYLFLRAPAPTVSMRDIKSPWDTILLGDQGDLRRGLFAPVAGHGGAMFPVCNVSLRHADGANFVFADGRVKYMKAGGAWSKDDTLWDLK
jgi:prepilin-type processing-associated H-X9-DG protein